MRTMIRMVLAAAACAAVPAFAANEAACARDPAGTGLAARVQNMHEKMDRAQWTTDPAEQRRLMELHGKLMREGVNELARRDVGMPCRLEMMSAMMEQMIQHQQAEQEAGAR